MSILPGRTSGGGNKSMKALDLFVGAGGLALGAAAAGFEHSVVTDWNRNAAETLRFNKMHGEIAKDWTIVEGDVRELDFESLCGSVDFVFAGPPCQPFSLGGKHQAHNDKRDMFPEVARSIRTIRPTAFIIENVKGILRPSFANYYRYVILQLTHPDVAKEEYETWQQHHARLERYHTSGKDTGTVYQVIDQVMNAANYGVPQRRERVFIVGIRSDLGLEFSFPTATHDEDALLHSQWISSEYWSEHRVAKKDIPIPSPRVLKRIERIKELGCASPLARWRTVRDAFLGLPRIAEGQTSRNIANHFLNSGARVYPGHDGSPFDVPAKTLKAGDHGVPGGENMLRYYNGRVRYFSVRECARLQTFPDEWVLCGSWTEGMRQLGNAVPVELGRVVAEKLRQTVIQDSETKPIRNDETRPLRQRERS